MITRRSAVTASLALSALATILSVAALLFSTGILTRASPVSANFEAQARAYLLENPEVVEEAMRGLEMQRQAAARDDIKVLLRDRHKDIFNDPSAPVLGNASGNVTLVEFFDYNCPYCRKAAPLLDQLQAGDKELRLVFKEFPILGPGSMFAARAALASQKQGKYEAFHDAMMAHKAAIDEGATLEIAREVGLDIDRLKLDMEDPAIAEAIRRNLDLAGDLSINGTPSFIVGGEIIRGLTDLPTLQNLIAETRTANEG